MAPRRVLRPAGRDRRRVPEEGPPVYVEGRLKTRKWQDKEGQDRYTTEIIADEMQLLGSREGGGGGGGGDVEFGGGSAGGGGAPRSGGAGKGAGTGGGAAKKPATPDDFDDDIPF